MTNESEIAIIFKNGVTTTPKSTKPLNEIWAAYDEQKARGDEFFITSHSESRGGMFRARFADIMFIAIRASSDLVQAALIDPSTAIRKH